ncbi:MAG TPA: hypothetical protein VK826_09050 [Bacteroidia bacterium]|nr:hypothetical protein [Bacteroidia bacterium]
MRYFFVALLGALLVIACSDNEGTTENTDSANCAVKPVNPNGDSELSILMREMAVWTDSCKAAVMYNRTIPAKPEKLNTLHTAKRTDENINESVYASMATLYQSKVTAFESANEVNDVELFNGMVDACVSCHNNFCQGPLVRINKMYIPTK